MCTENKYVKETDCMCINVTYQRMPIPLCECAYAYEYMCTIQAESLEKKKFRLLKLAKFIGTLEWMGKPFACVFRCCHTFGRYCTCVRACVRNITFVYGNEMCFFPLTTIRVYL